MITIFNTLYLNFSKKMEIHSILILRFAVAIVYIWFGSLKVIGISPAGELVEDTVYWFRPEIFVPILGIVEVIIGFGLLIKRFIPVTIILLLVHMTATFFPIFILQKACFDAFPYCPTLVGQYIIKNVVIISAAFVITGNYKKDNIEECLIT
ncbi:hypothetical protein [Flavobacterium cellulosilyticum]|uniref:DoxX family membrane protein n=1 Tax=Flavobacterium cellulosilyticum TaxID=2541731 RepID=A0A4R5C9K3_9FLAO|nr:hypothetical protein [Flavobacterium cellulosilyticum]TDD96571.1 hypothetical protein E0F76_11215 [Flavobacterium cellulosilyticum]